MSGAAGTTHERRRRRQQTITCGLRRDGPRVSPKRRSTHPRCAGEPGDEDADIGDSAGDDGSAESTTEGFTAAQIKGFHDRARQYRDAALGSAATKLNEMLPGEAGPPLDARLRAIVKSWLMVESGDARYAEILDAARKTLLDNQASRAEVVLPPMSFSTCKYFDDLANGGNEANAWYSEGRIYLCRPWLKATSTCQRVVLIHEFLHDSRLGDNPAVRTPEDALGDAGYMAGLASQLHSESAQSDRCDGVVDAPLPPVRG